MERKRYMENRRVENKQRTKYSFLSKQELIIIGLLAIIGLVSGGILSISQMMDQIRQLFFMI